MGFGVTGSEEEALFLLADLELYAWLQPGLRSILERNQNTPLLVHYSSSHFCLPNCAFPPWHIRSIVRDVDDEVPCWPNLDETGRDASNPKSSFILVSEQ